VWMVRATPQFSGLFLGCPRGRGGNTHMFFPSPFFDKDVILGI
jgi:hypothetical protein